MQSRMMVIQLQSKVNMDIHSRLMYPLSTDAGSTLVQWLNTTGGTKNGSKDKQKKSWMVMRSDFYHRDVITHSLARSGHALITYQSMEECRRLRHSMIGIVSTRMFSK